MKTDSPLAIWSLVLGILAIISCGPISGIPAIICGHMARSRIKDSPETLTGNGMAMAGLIMGYFSVVFFILLFFLGIVIAIMVPSMIQMFKDMPQGPAQPACSFLINVLSSLV
jgi:hypothetical protein